jgi:hypothetical protein
MSQGSLHCFINYCVYAIECHEMSWTHAREVQRLMVSLNEKSAVKNHGA